LLLVPGTIVDRYRVEAEIGRGGMARVYRVRHKSLDTLHALKVLTVGSEELRERLLREGRVQSQLDHPNVVPVRDVLDLPEGPGLLMDYIDGPTLDGWIVDHPTTLAERERVFIEVVEGVAWAHRRGVVHRDLKPGNVMMELRRGVWRPRVADFGLAKLVDVEPDEGDGSLRSRTGRQMGTPAYMSPEQVRSTKHVDQRADVFALGCILYELVCGKRAFVGEDTLDVFNRVAHGRFAPARDAVPGLAARIDAAIRGALEVDVDRRIPDCPTLLAVLRGELAWASGAGATLDGAALGGASPDPAPGRASMTFAGTVTVAPDGAARIEGEVRGLPIHVGAAPEVGRVGAGDEAGGPVTPTEQRDGDPSGVDGRRGRSATGAVLAVVVAILALCAGGIGASYLGGATISDTWAPLAELLGWRGPATPEAAAPDGATASDPASTSALHATPDASDPASTSALDATPDRAAASEPARAPGPAATTAEDVLSANAIAPSPPGGAATVASRPAGATASRPPPPGHGRVVISGDARLVRLRPAAGAPLAPGDVLAGSYVIEAAFGDDPPMHAGNLDLTAGRTVRLDCRAATLTCAP
jgi:hypothetical protein